MRAKRVEKPILAPLRRRLRRPVLVGVFLLCTGFSACSNPVSPGPGPGSGTPPGTTGTTTTMRFGSAGTFSLNTDGSPVMTMTSMQVRNYPGAAWWMDNPLPTLLINLSNGKDVHDQDWQNLEFTVSPTAGPHAIGYESDESDPAGSVTFDTYDFRFQAETGDGTITVSSLTTRSIAGSFDVRVDATAYGPGNSYGPGRSPHAPIAGAGSHRLTGEFTAYFDCKLNTCIFP